MELDMVVRNGTVVSASGRCRADIGIRGGTIALLAENIRDAGAATILDASDCFVLPGVIDAHVHPIHAETIETSSYAAAYGGVTTVLHYVYIEPNRGVIESLQAAREEGEATSVVDFGLHARLTNIPARLGELSAATAMGVRSFKLFMAYRRRGLIVPDEDLFQAMEAIGRLGAMALVHAENGSVIDLLEDQYRLAGKTRPEHYPATRPTAVEAEAVNRATMIASIANCPIYVVHISCAEALESLTRARQSGNVVFGETCPHYLSLTAEEAMPRFGAKAKIAPPLRTPNDIDVLWKGLFDRRLDVVASDHSAFDPAEKEGFEDNIFDAGFGAPGIESLLTVLHEAGVVQKRISLERLVELLSTAPARIFGLTKKGRIAPGMDADFIVFDPRAVTTATNDNLHGRAYYSLYEGQTLHGLPRTVVQRGKILVSTGRLIGRPGNGHFVAAHEASSTEETSLPLPRHQAASTH